MNHAGANQGQHGQATPGQDSRVWNDTLQNPQDYPHRPPGLDYRASSEIVPVSSAGHDDGRREEDEIQSQVSDILSLRCVMISGRVTSTDTGRSPPPQDGQSPIPVALYTRNAYAGTVPEGTSRDMNGHDFAMSSLGDAYTNNSTNSSRGMNDPTLRSDNDDDDLSVYELQSSAARRAHQAHFDWIDAQLRAMDEDDQRYFDSLPELEYFCPVGSCSRREEPFDRKKDWIRHMYRTNDPAHARFRAAIMRGPVEARGSSCVLC